MYIMLYTIFLFGGNLMSKDWYQDIVDFHKDVMCDEFPTKPYVPSDRLKTLRKELIMEEVKETLLAIDNDDIVELADGIADSIVVLLGTAVTYGIDIRPIWDEVHKTNMAKKDGPMRSDGKRLKPEGWKPPDIKSIINKQS